MILTTSSLDRETKEQYIFTVFVTDSRKPVYTSSAQVTVDVQDLNDCPPRFSSNLYTARVVEDDNNPGESQILTLVCMTSEFEHLVLLL